MAITKNDLLAAYGRYCKQIDHLFDELGRHDGAVLNRPGPGGGWSALQTMRHLLMSESLSLRYVQKKSQAPLSAFKKAGLLSSLRILAIVTYLHLPFKYKAPKVVAIETTAENIDREALRQEWLAVRQGWLDFFESLSPQLYDKELYKHPIGGRIGLLHMIAFFYHHTARHSVQVRRALA